MSENINRETLVAFVELLSDAFYLYQYYPNNFRVEPCKYFSNEIRIIKEIPGGNKLLKEYGIG